MTDRFHEKNGHAARSAATRARLITAAIEVFGTIGYDGASIRGLAKQSGVSLAAVSYHFGGKRELYIAAAQAIATHIRTKLDPIITGLLDTSEPDPVQRIDLALDRTFQLLMSDQEPAAWMQFFSRCEKEADEAFRIIYDTAIGHLVQGLTLTVANARNCDPDDDGLRIQIATVMTLYIGFRSQRNLAKAILGWDEVSQDRLEELRASIHRLAFGEFRLPLAEPRQT
ncbi:CerR family C-terminal domain-containing protein [Actibacterium sp. D379-3]